MDLENPSDVDAKDDQPNKPDGSTAASFTWYLISTWWFGSGWFWMFFQNEMFRTDGYPIRVVQKLPLENMVAYRLDYFAIAIDAFVYIVFAIAWYFAIVTHPFFRKRTVIYLIFFNFVPILTVLFFALTPPKNNNSMWGLVQMSCCLFILLGFVLGRPLKKIEFRFFRPKFDLAFVLYIVIVSSVFLAAVLFVMTKYLI